MIFRQLAKYPTSRNLLTVCIVWLSSIFILHAIARTIKFSGLMSQYSNRDKYAAYIQSPGDFKGGKNRGMSIPSSVSQ